MRSRYLRRLGRLASIAVIAGASGMTACSDFLQADNPGAIEADDLNDARYANLIANGVVGEFQPMLGYVTWWNAIFTDELYNRAVFFEEGLIDQRRVTPENGTHAFFIYGNLHRTRFLADDGVRRLKIILGDTASRDLRVARSLAYGGLTYVYMGEMYCAVPIDVSAPLPPAELFARAIERFQEAITVAGAAKTYLQSLPNAPASQVLAADSIRNFALIGAARAALNLNQKNAAIQFAQQVPAGFQFRAYYSANSTRENNWMWNRLTAGNNATTDNTPFAAKIDDPRINVRGGTGVTALIPMSAMQYSSWVPTAGTPWDQGGWVNIASTLEARYIIAEAEGPTPATLDFVNERRAIGQQPPVDLSGDALMAELREQRSRDLYLANYRLGDLRRYLEFYNINLFPQGPYPGSTAGDTYDATSTCWPLPLAELNDNPNVPRP